MFINCWSVSIMSISLLLQWGQKAFGRSRRSKIHWPKDVSPFHRGLRWTVLDEVLCTACICMWEVWSVLHVALANVSEVKQLFLGVLKAQRTQRSNQGRSCWKSWWNPTESPLDMHWDQILGFLARKLHQTAMQEELGKLIPKVQANLTTHEGCTKLAVIC